MSNTTIQYDKIVDKCKEIFKSKHLDYGSAWRILRLPSLTDQMYIKANRIRSIQESGINKIGDSASGEFVALVNYGLMAMIQICLGGPKEENLSLDEVVTLYVGEMDKVRELMTNKNHDYGEAWREMRVESITDLILVKLLRIKQIEDNDGLTTISEGVDGNYQDIINYALFALILLEEENNKR